MTVAALLLVQTGCAHETAFAVAGPDQRPPLDSGAYVSVTFNPGADLAPAWLSDGGGFLGADTIIDPADDLSRLDLP